MIKRLYQCVLCILSISYSHIVVYASFAQGVFVIPKFAISKVWMGLKLDVEWWQHDNSRLLSCCGKMCHRYSSETPLDFEQLSSEVVTGCACKAGQSEACSAVKQVFFLSGDKYLCYRSDPMNIKGKCMDLTNYNYFGRISFT